MDYTRNYDPHYYEEHQGCSNCGSFAFQVEEWYSPDEYFEDNEGVCIEAWIEHGFEFGWNSFDLSDELAGILISYVLDDFEDVRYLINPADIEADEELVAFRTFVDEDTNWDFHFKVLRDGLWQEKCGSDPVRFCEEDDWHNGLMEYISETSYFARKIAS